MAAVVVVFSKPDCPHCVAAKKLLDDRGIEFTTVDMTDATRAVLAQYTTAKTVPQIFINDILVEGGNAGLQEAAKSGKLDEMMKTRPSSGVLYETSFAESEF